VLPFDEVDSKRVRKFFRARRARFHERKQPGRTRLPLRLERYEMALARILRRRPISMMVVIAASSSWPRGVRP